jgi:hypothetical protein
VACLQEPWYVQLFICRNFLLAVCYTHHYCCSLADLATVLCHAAVPTFVVSRAQPSTGVVTESFQHNGDVFHFDRARGGFAVSVTVAKPRVVCQRIQKVFEQETNMNVSIVASIPVRNITTSAPD